MSNVSPRLVTNSELKTFRRCIREHHLAYRLGYRPVHEAEALRVGTLVHRGLEAYWRAWESWHTDPMLAVIEARAAVVPFAIDAYDLARAEVMLLAYHTRWIATYVGGHFDVIGVETEFRAPLINPATGAPSRTYEIGGKIDALIRRDNGRVYLVEHKTTTEPIGAGTPYWLRLTIDAQVSMYYRGARSLGHDVAGCEYDVLTRPLLRPLLATPIENRKYNKKTGEIYENQRNRDETPDEFHARLVDAIAENPDRYFQRGEVVRFESEERDAAFDVWQITRAMREAELAERFPRNPDACMRFGRPCDFFGVCTGTASLDDPDQFRVVTNVHEELSTVVGGAT